MNPDERASVFHLSLCILVVPLTSLRRIPAKVLYNVPPPCNPHSVNLSAILPNRDCTIFVFFIQFARSTIVGATVAMEIFVVSSCIGSRFS